MEDRVSLYFNDMLDYGDINVPVLEYLNEYVEVVFDAVERIDLDQ